MTLDETCGLSFYRQVGVLNEEHGVYLVQHTVSGRVFVKKTLMEYDAGVFRYLKEHPVANTPCIYELVEDGRSLTVIEEYVSGVSLRELLETEGTFSEARTAEVAKRLCAILQQLHSALPPIIHRDIKPSNIILSQDGVVTLLDMNAAKWFRDDTARDTKLIGTIGYAAPEQYGFGASTPRTDVYSLGILMNVMLTGTFPQTCPAGGRLGDVIQKCTRMEPRERYQSMAEVRAAIDGNEQRDFKSWLPPGFRKFHPVKALFAGLGYFCLFALSLSLRVDSESAAVIWLNRLSFAALFLLVILFSGNYRGILDRLRITNIRRKWLRATLVILLDVGIAAICFIVLVILEQWIS